MDPSLNHVVSDPATIKNYAGLLGAYVSGTLSDLFGVAAYIWPLVCGAVGVACIAPQYELMWWRWLGYFLLTICLLFTGAAWDLHVGEIYGGGLVGSTLYEHASRLLSHWGSVILWFFLFCTAIQLTFGLSWLKLYHKVKALCQTRISAVSSLERPALPPLPLPNIKNLWEKLTSRPAQKALPQVYDVDAEESDATDDPAIRVVKRSKPSRKKVKKAQETSQEDLYDSASDQYQDAYDEQYDERYEYYDEHHYEQDVEQDVDQYVEQEDYAQAPAQGRDNSSSGDSQKASKKPAAPKTSRGLFSFGKKEEAPATSKTPTRTQSKNNAQEDDYKNAHENTHEEFHEEAYNKSDSEDSPPHYDDNYDDNYDDGYDDDDHGHHESLEDVYDDTYEETPPAKVKQQAPQPSKAKTAANPALPKKRKYVFPSLDLLQDPAPSSPTARGEMEKKGQALVSCLADFGIQGELVHITPGPVVTMYAFRPAAGVRVNRIANLTDDIALALKALAIRIQAPIPGSDTVGIEIPNIQRDIVNFREILESQAFSEAGGPLNMVLGKNIAGKPFVSELSKMPHLLVAGATGAGKSVGLNTILMSLLYTTQPDDMQLLLIDPKRIEMAVYADLPHLVHPVVTEMQYAKTALEWAVAEMDKRYEAMARVGVRNITGYNQKIKEMGDNKSAELADFEPLPYLVIIIDELADLMLTAAREVETSIVRLAQLARAAGIHMILATQRPSVDVVTGIIKANFPCRISFQVTSKHDSRTILDMVGAEHLLGKGDMLFKPSGGRLMRLHGPFVADEEVQAVVSHWKRQSPPKYKVDFAQWGQEQNEVSGGGLGGDASADSLYPEVRAFVEEQGKASISLVQRRFRIGFNRAAVLMEQLERDGIIGPADGSKPRSVIR